MENIPAKYPNYTVKNFLLSFSIVMLFIFLNLFGWLFLYTFFKIFTKNIGTNIITGTNNTVSTSVNTQGGNNVDAVKKFQSEGEYLEYISSINLNNNTGQGLNLLERDGSKSPTSDSSKAQSNPVSADRYSTTNVQTVGIDEPDVLKSDGTYFYFSKIGFQYYYSGVRQISPSFGQEDSDIRPPDYNQGTSSSYNLLPVDQISKIQELKEGGTLMLYKNILVINSQNSKLTAYDVSDPKEYKKVWEIIYDSREFISQMRSDGQDLFVITNSILYPTGGCVVPLYKLEQANNSKITNVDYRCTDIYYPISNTTNNSKVTISKLNIINGELKKNLSFLTGTNYNNILYMSTDNIYIAYQRELDNFKISSEFITSINRIPTNIKSKIAYIASLNISNASKVNELNYELNNYQNSLDSNDRLAFTNELQNSFNDYAKNKAADWINTDIVKISLNLDIDSTGSINGTILNQFALDEYKGYLRVSTTIEPNLYILNYYYSGNDKSKSTVYILDGDMKVVGQVGDIGKGERIFGVRYFEKYAYVVTFRQTDPFYIVDLSDANSPKVTGELKIPGYSSYLHVIDENLVLGIGMEGSSLKLSLFDTSNKSNPIETSKYLLAEYGSEVLQDHHAFLVDQAKKVFFIPGYNGGYIFNYADQTLKLEKAIAGAGIKRAMYVNDYMYLLSEDTLTVVGNDYEVKTVVSL